MGQGFLSFTNIRDGYSHGIAEPLESAFIQLLHLFFLPSLHVLLLRCLAWSTVSSKQLPILLMTGNPRWTHDGGYQLKSWQIPKQSKNARVAALPGAAAATFAVFVQMLALVSFARVPLQQKLHLSTDFVALPSCAPLSIPAWRLSSCPHCPSP